jgi:hypothetical protein
MSLIPHKRELFAAGADRVRAALMNPGADPALREHIDAVLNAGYLITFGVETDRNGVWRPHFSLSLSEPRRPGSKPRRSFGETYDNLERLPTDAKRLAARVKLASTDPFWIAFANARDEDVEGASEGMLAAREKIRELIHTANGGETA